MKKTAFLIFTFTLTILASFKSALAATSPMGLAIQTIIGLVTPIFDAFRQTNGQGVILIKFVLWLLLFAVLFSVSGPLFKGRKAIAGIVAGVIALISIVMIPDQMVLSIAYEYSGIATFIFLVAPIFCMFWLNKKIPDTPIGDAMKFFIYLVMAILAWKLLRSAQQMTTPFLKEIVGSVWWILFAIIVSAAAARYLWKFGASTFAGPHMERGAGWAGEKGRSIWDRFRRGTTPNPALIPPTTPPTTTPPPGGAGPVIPTPPGTPPIRGAGPTTPTPGGATVTIPPATTTTTPPGVPPVVGQSIGLITQYTKDIKAFEDRRGKISKYQLREIDEQIKHIELAEKLAANTLTIYQTIAGEGSRAPSPDVVKKFQDQARGMIVSINAELQEIAKIIIQDSTDLKTEYLELQKEFQEIGNMRGRAVMLVKSTQDEIKQAEAALKDPNRAWEIDKNEQVRQGLENQLHLVEALAKQGENIANIFKQIWGIIGALTASISNEDKIIRRIISAGQVITQQTINDLNQILQSAKNRKNYIAQTEDLYISLREQIDSFDKNRNMVL